MERVTAKGIDFVKCDGHITPSSIATYIMSNAVTLHPAQKKLIEITKKLPDGGMMGDINQLNFFQFLLKTINAKKVVDVGVFTGCSALAAALAIPDDGQVYALDVEEEFVNIGKPYFKEAKVDHKYNVKIGSAITLLDNMLNGGFQGTIDFVFIDATKLEYEEYYERSLKLLRKGGIIAFDNMLQGGRVLNPDGHANASFCVHLTNKICNDPRVVMSLLPIGDGVLFALKK